MHIQDCTSNATFTVPFLSPRGVSPRYHATLGLQRKVADADISQGILKLTPGSTNTVPGTVCFSTLFSNLEHHHIGDGSKALFPPYGSVVI